VGPSLTRDGICTFPTLLVLASAVFLGSESCGTHDHILLPQFLRLPNPVGPGSHIYIPQEQGGPVILPGILFTFITSLHIHTHTHTYVWMKIQFVRRRKHFTSPLQKPEFPVGVSYSFFCEPYKTHIYSLWTEYGVLTC
jgi:hypothetical protein